MDFKNKCLLLPIFKASIAHSVSLIVSISTTAPSSVFHHDTLDHSATLLLILFPTVFLCPAHYAVVFVLCVL